MIFTTDLIRSSNKTYFTEYFNNNRSYTKSAQSGNRKLIQNKSQGNYSNTSKLVIDGNDKIEI